MPSWKKVIISGSDAALNSLNVTTSVTASIVSASAGLITDNIQFNTGTSTVVGEGQLAWNPTDGTLDLGMKGGLATQQIGQETYYPLVVNKTAGILREGTLVMVDPIAPSFGNRLSVIKAVTDGTYPTDLLVGIITEDIAINGEGFATWFGYVRNLNENNLETYGIKRAGETWVEGNILYPDPIYPGGLTNVEPSAPSLKSTIAAITTVNGVNITLLTRPIFKFKVEELSDVGNTSQNGDLLVKSGSIWTPSKQLSGSYGLTGSLQATSFTGSLFGTASYTNVGSLGGFIQGGNSFGTTATLGTNDNNSLQFETNNSTRMFISSSGNVGIGTTAPYSKFTTLGALSTSTSQISIVNSEGGHTILRTGISGISNAGFSLISADVAGTNQNTRLVVNVAGNVGIGTTSPTAKLEAYKGAQSDTITRANAAAYFYGADIGLAIGQSASGPYGTWLQSLKYNDNVTFPLALNPAGGNVGIGTTSPGAKLDVEGDVLIKAANLSNQENTDVDTGTEVVATVAIATYTAAFFDFVIKNGTNVRSGTVFACHDGTNVEFTETSTADLGTTSPLTLSVDISSGNMRLLATATTDNWSVKTLVRAL